MRFYNIFNILLFTIHIVNVISFNFETNKNNLFQNNIPKLQLLNDLKKMSLLSKLIYDYDYIHPHNPKNKFLFNLTNTNNLKNISVDFTKKNNIYFNLMQHITFLDNKDFIKDTEKYFYLINKYFPEVEIYGYFYNKQRLHSLILLNHKDKEIIVVFRGCQYLDEWISNLKLNEKHINFDIDKNTIHNGIYEMYTQDNIDNNIIYILTKLFNYLPNYRKIITGHSKGSINSILLSFELLVKLENKYNYEIFCFGSPPLFNIELGKKLHNNPNICIYNVINELDIITFIPIFGKFQIGNEIFLDDDNIYFRTHKSPYKIKNMINISNFYNSIINHNLNIYIKKIFENKFKN